MNAERKFLFACLIFALVIYAIHAFGLFDLLTCNFAFFSGLIGAQFWAERAQPKSPELDAKLLASC